LLKAGADLDTCSSPDAWSPLLVALSNGHLDVANRLLDEGANVTHRTKTGVSALHMIAGIITTDAQKRSKQIDITEKLLQKGCEVESMAQRGPDLIMSASSGGSLEVFNLFLSRGALLDGRNQHDYRATHIAAIFGHLPIINRLLEVGVDANVLDDERWSPLMHAAYRGKTDVVERLLQAQANPNQVGNLFDTPLLLATSLYWESIVEVLLDYGADPWALDAFGKSAVEWSYLYEQTTQVMKKRNLVLKASGEAIVTSRLRLSVRLVIERIISDPWEDDSRFNSLGHVLIKLNEVDDSCVAFEQQIINRDRVRHDITCDSCKLERIEGKRFVCRICATMDLCNECMSKYKEGMSVRNCVGHEFLEVPRPEWDSFAPEAVNKNDETIHQWTERIYLTYRDAVISPEEACAIAYEGPPANLPVGASTISQRPQLEPIIEVDSQSGPPTSPNVNIDTNEILSENENPISGGDAATEVNNTQILLPESEVRHDDAGSTSEDVNRGESTNADLIQTAGPTTDTTVATLSGSNGENSESYGEEV
jgi:ankyrin repeat protein